MQAGGRIAYGDGRGTKLWRLDSTGKMDMIFVKNFFSKLISEISFERGTAAACKVMDEKQELAERFNG